MKSKTLEVFTVLRDLSVRKEPMGDEYRKIYEGLEETGTLDADYAENLGDRNGYALAKNADVLSFKDCCTVLTFLLRAEHWTPGAFNDALQSGSIHRLLKRAVEVLKDKEENR